MTSFIDTETLDTRGGRVRIVRMARPPVNALNPELCRGLIAALEAAADLGADAESAAWLRSEARRALAALDELIGGDGGAPGVVTGEA